MQMTSGRDWTYLGSNFFDLLALVNSAKHFKKYSCCLVSLSELSPIRDTSWVLLTTESYIKTSMKIEPFENTKNNKNTVSNVNNLSACSPWSRALT